ncbi:hypothetical protein, partial [Vibrio cholerae]|uniref:hypothetical protein n=1 Tax=Vibrio cholerae TaxID=666 RepID=UPI001F4015C5
DSVNAFSLSNSTVSESQSPTLVDEEAFEIDGKIVDIGQNCSQFSRGCRAFLKTRSVVALFFSTGKEFKASILVSLH